jgi:hypothetical protein
LFDIDADPLEQHNLVPSATGTEVEVVRRLRQFLDQTIDFHSAERDRQEDEVIQQTHALEVEWVSASGNCYLMPNGGVVDADQPLYDPTVLAENPAAIFDDFPE